MLDKQSHSTGARELQPAGQIWLTVFINKVLLENRHTYLFIYCLWLLYTKMTELSSRGRDHMVPQSKTQLLFGPLQKKLTTPLTEK